MMDGEVNLLLITNNAKETNMGKKKDKREFVYMHKMLFSVNTPQFSGNANKHNARVIKSLLDDLGIKYKEFNYHHDEIVDTAFQVDMKYKEVVKEICQKFNVETCLSLYQTESGKYSVFKEETDSIKATGAGWLEQKTKGECQMRESFYFYDDEGHYFTVGRQGSVLDKPVEVIKEAV